MTFLRKWRFPILIGSGLIAAGVLIYFANTHVGFDKTQGAIGKRDVYRDGQVASADVATQGSAPVATQAILESSEFKAVVKNPAFQQLVRDDEFTELNKQGALAGLLADPAFRKLAGDESFKQLLQSDLFINGVRERLSIRDLTASLQRESSYNRLIDKASLNALLEHNSSLRVLAGSHALDNLLAKSYFQALILDKSFALLTERNGLEAALDARSAAGLQAHSSER
jgi:hypothetical protein